MISTFSPVQLPRLHSHPLVGSIFFCDGGVHRLPQLGEGHLPLVLTTSSMHSLQNQCLKSQPRRTHKWAISLRPRTWNNSESLCLFFNVSAPTLQLDCPSMRQTQLHAAALVDCYCCACCTSTLWGSIGAYSFTCELSSVGVAAVSTQGEGWQAKAHLHGVMTGASNSSKHTVHSRSSAAGKHGAVVSISCDEVAAELLANASVGALSLIHI